MFVSLNLIIQKYVDLNVIISIISNQIWNIYDVYILRVETPNNQKIQNKNKVLKNNKTKKTNKKHKKKKKDSYFLKSIKLCVFSQINK